MRVGCFRPPSVPGRRVPAAGLTARADLTATHDRWRGRGHGRWLASPGRLRRRLRRADATEPRSRVRIVRRATDIVARSKLSVVDDLGEGRLRRGTRPRRSAAPTPRSARSGRRPARGGEDVGRQPRQRGVQVVAQRRPGQRGPAVVARQAGDAGEQRVDLEPLGQREVDRGDLLGRAASPPPRSPRRRAARTRRAGAALQREVRGHAERLELGRAHQAGAPARRRRAGSGRAARARRSPAGSARSRRRRRCIARRALQQPAGAPVEQPARLEVERGLPVGARPRRPAPRRGPRTSSSRTPRATTV